MSQWGRGGLPACTLTWAHGTPRRFSSSVALTPEEQEQRALYAAILEYEQDHVSTRWRLLPQAPWGQDDVLWGRMTCCGAGHHAMGQGEVLSPRCPS